MSIESHYGNDAFILVMAGRPRMQHVTILVQTFCTLPTYIPNVKLPDSVVLTMDVQVD